MTPRRALAASAVAATALAFASIAAPSRAHACGYGGSTEWTLGAQPDLPLDEFVRGRVGIVLPSWSRSFLAVAFRQLAGTALDEAERASALRAWSVRGSVPLTTVSTAAARATPGSANTCAPSAPGATPARRPALYEFDARETAGREHWFAALRAAGVTPPGSIATNATSGHAYFTNCLPDAFENAASTLQARMRSAGAVTPAVRAWVDAQQLVFRNCERSGGAAIPAELPATAPAPERADRAYQIASAHFYAGSFGDAAQRFGAIAADAQSPWAPWGRYLVARSVVRGATLESERNNAGELRRAREMVRAILADRAQAPAHGAARHYAVTIDSMLAPRQVAHELGVRLARDPLGEAFGETLYDFAHVLDRDDSALAITEPDADRLSAFISVMGSAQDAAFQRALRLYTASREPVWLVAALTRAPNLADPSVDPLLRAAEAVPASHPASLTLLYLRAKALHARHNYGAAYTLATTTMAPLGADEMRSARNLLLALATKSATRFEDFARVIASVEAGASEEGTHLSVPMCTGAACDTHVALHPDAASMLAGATPTSVWLRLANTSTVPERVRAMLAAHGLVRAALLDDAALIRTAAPLAERLNPAVANRVRVLAAARTAPERKLALADLVLHSATLGPTLRFGEGGPATELTLDSTMGGMSLWCAANAPFAAVEPIEPAHFLTAPERAALAREQNAFRTITAGPTYLAHELAGLAERFRTDARMPELLHLAVRATRYGCRDTGVTPASREAFRALHRLFPNNEFTRRTPYFY